MFDKVKILPVKTGILHATVTDCYLQPCMFFFFVFYLFIVLYSLTYNYRRKEIYSTKKGNTIILRTKRLQFTSLQNIHIAALYVAMNVHVA